MSKEKKVRLFTIDKKILNFYENSIKHEIHNKTARDSWERGASDISANYSHNRMQISIKTQTM